MEIKIDCHLSISKTDKKGLNDRRVFEAPSQSWAENDLGEETNLEIRDTSDIQKSYKMSAELTADASQVALNFNLPQPNVHQPDTPSNGKEVFAQPLLGNSSTEPELAPTPLSADQDLGSVPTNSKPTTSCACPYCRMLSDSLALLTSPQVEAVTTGAIPLDLSQSTPLDLSQTFFLNSLPGANHTIYLDFNGNITSGTGWNTVEQTHIVTPAFDFDGDASTFSNAELEQIQYIWQRVAEDYAPFNVNITTQAPADLNDLINTGGGDTRWGTRVAIGGRVTDWYGSLPTVGISWVGGFGQASLNTAFVFSDSLPSSNKEKSTAEVISHEAGHTLGLNHSVSSSLGSGETGWAPIMNSSLTSQALTQWDNSTQDNLGFITAANGFGYRTDDTGNTIATAKALTVTGTSLSGSGIIERNTDLDFYSFFTGAGSISLTVNPQSRGPNLDILARLYNAAGTLLVTSNPVDLLSATITTTVTEGTYYLSIDGTGNSTTGYTDYGSLGQYFISGTAAPTVTLSVSPASVLEDSASSLVYTFTRTSSVTNPLTVNFTVGGTATFNTDYTQTGAASFTGMTGSVTFATGATTATVTLAPVADSITESDETVILTLSSGTGYVNITTPATATIINDDAAIKLTQSGGSTIVREGGAIDTYTIVLNTQPIADVTITLNAGTQLTTSVTTLTFTSTNWNIAQTVTVIAVNDTAAEGTHKGTITHTTTSADVNYNGMVIPDVNATIIDNDLVRSTPTFQAPSTNPFGLTRSDFWSSPSLVDIDGDGDLDAFVGALDGNTRFYQNTGSASAPSFAAPLTNHFGLTDVGYGSNPTFVDIDGDGDFDAFVGVVDGSTRFYQNTGSASTPSFVAPLTNPFGLTQVGSKRSPTFVDIDGDGDLDAFLGNNSGNTLFYQNTGSVSTPAFATPITNHFGLTNVGENSNPTFVDIDGDGDLDALIGNKAANTLFYQNTGSVSAPSFAIPITNPFGLTNVDNYNKPIFVDIDGDSDLDAFIGNNFGDTLFYQNNTERITITQSGGSNTLTEGGAPATYTVSLFIRPQADVTVTLNGGTQLNPSATTLTFTSANWESQTVTLTAVDDSVGEGTRQGAITYTFTSTDETYNNLVRRFPITIRDNDLPLGTSTFQAPSTNPFGLTGVGNNSRPILVDIDGDADLDALVSNSSGQMLFYQNTGSVSAPAFDVSSTNPFGLTDVGPINPSFVDIDGDGDLDILAGRANGNMLFYRNAGNLSTPIFTIPTPDRFGLTDVGLSSSPSFVDVDADGDLDAFVGNRDGNTLFYQNTGNVSVPAFATPITNPFGLTNVGVNSNPTFVDIDGDGDLDALIGNWDGNTLFYQNTGSASIPAFVASSTNPFGLTDVGSNSSPSFVDIDADGDLDALVGRSDGNTLFYRNTRNVSNQAPTTVTLTNLVTAIAENSDTTSRIKVADIAITDDALGTNTLSLEGADAASFEIDGTVLYLKAGTALNFEAQSHYEVTVDVDDASVGSTPDTSVNFTLSVTDVNEAPTSLTLSNNTIRENSLKGTEIGTLSTTDVDAGDSFTYQIKTAAGALIFTGIPFALVGNSLQVNGLMDFEANSQYLLTIRTTDAGGAFLEEVLTLNVLDVVTNTLVGTPSSDEFLASNEIDDIQTLDGNDIVRLSLGNLQSNDRLDGGTGSDTLIVLGGTAGQRLTLDLANSNQWSGVSGASVSNVVFQNFENVTLVRFSGDAQVTGSDGVNKLTGGAGNDTLSGLGGKDSLTGNAGSDVLVGGLGNDLLSLGANDGATDQVLYSLGDGSDRVSQFERGVGGDQLRVSGILSIDVRVINGNTEFRVGDGIEGNVGFGTGALLLKFMATTGFDSTDEGVDLFNLTTPSGGFLFS